MRRASTGIQAAVYLYAAEHPECAAGNFISLAGGRTQPSVTWKEVACRKSNVVVYLLCYVALTDRSSDNRASDGQV